MIKKNLLGLLNNCFFTKFKETSTGMDTGVLKDIVSPFAGIKHSLPRFKNNNIFKIIMKKQSIYN